MILWFGWYGFNPGSQLVLVGLQNSFAVSNCAVTTTLAPAAAGLSSLLVKAIMSHMTTGVLPQTVAWYKDNPHEEGSCTMTEAPCPNEPVS